MITKLQTAGVTSVLLAGDPVFPTFLTREATTQGFFPEWVVLGYAFTDTAVFGRQYDQQQWAHAFGVSLLPARTADDVDELGNLITWQTGAPARGEDVPRSSCRRRSSSSPACTSPVPQLTAKTFRAGLVPLPAGRRHHADAPAPVVGSPRHLEGRRPHRRRRRHRDLVGPRRDRPRRGRARAARACTATPTRAPATSPASGPTHPVGLYDDADVEHGAHRAPARGPAAELPVAGLRRHAEPSRP